VVLMVVMRDRSPRMQVHQRIRVE